MSIKVDKHKKGFTLIEIIVVISIIAVLSAVTVPSFSGYIEKARIRVDQTNLDTLNNSTMLFRDYNNIYSGDIFENITSNKDRMLALVNDGLLEKTIKAQQKNVRFAWYTQTQKWGFDVAMTKEEALAKGFVFSKETGAITQYDGSDKDVQIPYKIGGVLVTKIGNNAFEGKGLISLIIPDTLETIGDSAFKNNNLTLLVIPDSVTSLGRSAFQKNNLEAVKLSASLTIIKQGTFDNNQLKTLKIPSGVGTLEYAAFRNNQLTSVELADSVGTIGHNAFEKNKLKKITFPSTMKVLGQYAFKDNQLEEIIIPSLVETIEREVFIENKITLINIQGKPKNMHDTAFNKNGPNMDKDIIINLEDCPAIYKMNSTEELTLTQTMKIL